MAHTRSGIIFPGLTSPTTKVRSLNFTSALKESRKKNDSPKSRLKKSDQKKASQPTHHNKILQAYLRLSLKHPMNKNTLIHAHFNTRLQEIEATFQRGERDLNKPKNEDLLHCSLEDAFDFISAAIHGQEWVITALKKKGLNVTKIISDNKKILLLVIQAYCHCSKINPALESFKNIIIYLVNHAKKNKDQDLLDVADNLGNSGLHFAASYNDLWLVRVLMDSGACHNLPNNAGYRPYEMGNNINGTNYDTTIKKMLSKDLVYLPTLGFDKQRMITAAPIKEDEKEMLATDNVLPTSLKSLRS